MNRTIKDATVKRFYDETHDPLRSHLADFVTAHNFAKRLKTLKGLKTNQSNSLSTRSSKCRAKQLVGVTQIGEVFPSKEPCDRRHYP